MKKVVPGSWFLVLGSWFLVLGFWFLAFGRDRFQSARYQVRTTNHLYVLHSLHFAQNTDRFLGVGSFRGLIETKPKDEKDEKDIKGLGGGQFRHHEGSILVNFDSTQ